MWILIPIAFLPEALLPDTRWSADTLRMQLVWEIAPGKQPVADFLGELSSIAADRAGTIYVSDFSNSLIWVFDPSGRPLPSFGRRGEGPGEFQAPTGLGVGPDGVLYVRDLSRVSRFGPDSVTGRLTKFQSSFLGPAMSDWRSMRPTRFDSMGRLYFPHFSTVGRSIATGRYYRYDLRGQRLDSVVVPPFPDARPSTASFRTGPHGGRSLRGLNYAPFEPQPVWDVTPRGTLLLGTGQTYVLEERSADGRLLRTYQRAVPADRILPRERRDSLAALNARLDSVPVPLERVEGMSPAVRRRQLPPTYPLFMAAYAANDGTVWIRRWPVAGPARTIFDVFGADGRLLTTVTLPRAIALEPHPILSLTRIVAIGVDQDTGAHLVLGFAAKAQ